MWAIGRRAYLHCAQATLQGVVLTDEAGTMAQLSLSDGTPVEITAWRPHGSSGPRYRVREVNGAADGWVDAHALRETPAPPPPASAAPVAANGDTSGDPYGRRFGQR